MNIFIKSTVVLSAIAALVVTGVFALRPIPAQAGPAVSLAPPACVCTSTEIAPATTVSNCTCGGTQCIVASRNSASAAASPALSCLK